jgi:hypothetical protein
MQLRASDADNISLVGARRFIKVQNTKLSKPVFSESKYGTKYTEMEINKKCRAKIIEKCKCILRNKMDLQELGCGSTYWIELAQDREK